MGEFEAQIGERIRKNREQLGISQRQLAELVGTPPPNINLYEKGNRSAPLIMLTKLARALGVSTDSLLLGTTHEGFCDKDLNEVFKDFSALPPRDRKIIVEMIKFLKHHPNE